MAAAKTFASKGMKVFLADIDAELLESARKQVDAAATGGEVESMVVDVSKLADVVALKDKVMELWGEVSSGFAVGRWMLRCLIGRDLDEQCESSQCFLPFGAN